MDAEIHQQFVDGVKSLKSYEAICKKMAEELSHLRAFIVQQENDAVSRDKALKMKQEQLEQIERQMREKRLMSDTNDKNVRDRLDARHLELVEREAKVRMAEEAAQEQLRKANALLAAAEAKAGPRKMAAAAK